MISYEAVSLGLFVAQLIQYW